MCKQILILFLCQEKKMLKSLSHEKTLQVFLLVDVTKQHENELTITSTETFVDFKNFI